MAGNKDDQIMDDMSDDLDEEEKGGFKAKKLVLFVVLPILLLGGGGAAAYLTGMLDSVLGVELNCDEVEEGDDDFEKCEEKHAEEGGDSEGGGDSVGVFFEMPDLIVNLNSAGRQPRYLKISIQLEVKDDEALKKVEAVMPRIVDHFQTYLRELRLEDLKGSAGMYRLRLELLSRVSAAAPDVKVRDVLFQEFVVQ